MSHMEIGVAALHGRRRVMQTSYRGGTKKGAGDEL